MGLAPKGSKSSTNKISNSTDKYAPNNPVDRRVRSAMSKGDTAKGRTIKATGEMVAMASPKTRNKAEAIAKKRSK